jgi:ABC-type antimicrobial peptide transport system permease subunit
MDPLVLASVAGVLFVVAVAACAVPARRAARIDPVVALGE